MQRLRLLLFSRTAQRNARFSRKRNRRQPRRLLIERVEERLTLTATIYGTISYYDTHGNILPLPDALVSATYETHNQTDPDVTSNPEVQSGRSQISNAIEAWQ